MPKETDERHRYGQHYTPETVARVLAAFGVRSAADLILDPSCGDGRLLAEALRLKAFLASPESREKAISTNNPIGAHSAEVFGIERSPVAVVEAAKTGAVVACADFFDIEPGARLNESVALPDRFDAIIGNPPYIRQEVMGAPLKRRIAIRLAAANAQSPEILSPGWSGRSDIYVYFFARAAGFLKPGGRLVFLTASSWLDVGYGVALQKFLLNNFRVVALVESAAESFFAGASINTVITVLEREHDPAARAKNRVRFVQILAPLRETMERVRARLPEQSIGESSVEVEFARRIERCDSPVVSELYRLRVVSQRDLSEKSLPAETCSAGNRGRQRRGPVIAGSSWGRYLRAGDLFFSVVERGDSRLRPLSDMARVRFGVKTGANEFFYVTPHGRGMKNDAGAGMKPLSDVASVRRGITTGANEFFYLRVVDGVKSPQRIGSGAEGCLVLVEDGSGGLHAMEAEFLSPVVFSLKEIPGILLEQHCTKRLFFDCSAAPEEIVGTKALDYIRVGERAGYHQRPSCAARNPWYAAARGREPAPLLFPSKVGERWLVALNRAGVFEDKKLYGVFPCEGVPARLLAALLNSTWARYYSEMTCRQMTGAQAIADIDVAVAEQILLPDPRVLAQDQVSALCSALDALTCRPVLSVFEEVSRHDRRRLDEVVLEAIGFVKTAEREAALDELYQAVTEVVRRRLARARAQK